MANLLLVYLLVKIIWVSVFGSYVFATPPTENSQVTPLKLENITGQNDGKIQIESDSLNYFKQKGIAHAKGNVSMIYFTPKGTQKLNCQELTFDLVNNRVTAMGNVSMTDYDGNTAFSDHIELTKNLRDASIQTIKIITKDNSRFKAQNAQRTDGNTTTMNKASYSPCKICEGKSPTWELTAQEIIHDEQTKMITYKNVFLELKGIKVFYLPYFSHPDPSVKRKSGFLFPSLGMDNNLGQFYSLPYYKAIDIDKDLTFTHMLSTKKLPLLMGQYRQRFFNGESDLEGSVTYTEKSKKADRPNLGRTRWHVHTSANYHPDDENKFYAKLIRASDTTYLRKYKLHENGYNFSSKKNLESKFGFEHYKNELHISATGIAFQTDTPQTTPWVLPKGRFLYLSPKLNNKYYLEAYGDFLSLIRKKHIVNKCGKQVQRGSFGTAVVLPHINNYGQIFTLRLDNRMDLYHTKDFFQNLSPQQTKDHSKNNFAGRIFPQASLTWQYPLYKNLQSFKSYTLEPKACLCVSPREIKRGKIPNEDSKFFTMDESNIFNPNRFDGIDKVDHGSRFAYGVNNTLDINDIQKIDLFVGHTLRINRHTPLYVTDGETNNQSDYIFQGIFNASRWLAIQNRMGIDPKSQKTRYNETGFLLGNKKLQLDLAYVEVKKYLPNVNEKTISQINIQVKSAFAENWEISIAQIRNLKTKMQNKNVLGNFANITYQDDCFTMKGSIYQNKTNDRDIRPDKGFLLSFIFKNLGNFTPYRTNQYTGSPITRYLKTTG